MVQALETPKGASARRLIGGAMGLLLLSRMIGLAREAAIVALIGVHDYTDAYFAMSAVVGWLQNWSFGAFSLYFVPKYLLLEGPARRLWVAHRTRMAAVSGGVLGLVFLAAYQPLERLMLSGRNVLAWPAVALLAACIPVTTIGGVKWGEVISRPSGILGSARALAIANACGLIALVGVVGTTSNRFIALPASLAISQFVALALLTGQARAMREDADGPAGSGLGVARGANARASHSSQAVATTVENVGFNLSALIQQAIAGRMSDGAITLNAYANRLILVPLTGIMQPVQQRLLIKFASETEQQSRKALRAVAKMALGLGLALGLAVVVAGYALAPLLGPKWRATLSDHRYPIVLGAYALYAGVVFVNQGIARMLFAHGRGAAYATVMLIAYSAANAIRFLAAPHWGMLALPLGALVAEGAACTYLYSACFREIGK
jgi:peptidoglycan biosynthesis protein MviN/MurJ (putative lipid II flippase)